MKSHPSEIEILACPSCGMEIVATISHCPRCNTRITGGGTDDQLPPPFPTLDDNSGRIVPDESGSTDTAGDNSFSDHPEER